MALNFLEPSLNKDLLLLLLYYYVIEQLVCRHNWVRIVLTSSYSHAEFSCCKMILKGLNNLSS